MSNWQPPKWPVNCININICLICLFWLLSRVAGRFICDLIRFRSRTTLPFGQITILSCRLWLVGVICDYGQWCSSPYRALIAALCIIKCTKGKKVKVFLLIILCRSDTLHTHTFLNLREMCHFCRFMTHGVLCKKDPRSEKIPAKRELLTLPPPVDIESGHFFLSPRVVNSRTLITKFAAIIRPRVPNGQPAAGQA